VAGILITVLIGLVILAVFVFIIQRLTPFDPGMKQLILLIAAVVFLIWLILLLTGQASVFMVPRLGGPR
jgi:hypothetical protein